MLALGGREDARLSGSLAARIARGYDAIADGYDAETAGDAWMRAILRRRYGRAFRAGDRVLDLGCGTGLDAAWLAGRGVQVVGLDVSGGMLRHFQRRVQALGLSGKATAARMDLARLGLRPRPAFGGAISGFAALDTVTDTRALFRHLATLLRPGALLIIHVLNRASFWERLPVVRGRQATRRSDRAGPRDFQVGPERLEHACRSATDWSALAAPIFQTRTAFDLGWLRPPHTTRRLPGAVTRQLEAVEAWWAGRLPALLVGRLLVLELERTSTDAATGNEGSWPLDGGGPPRR